MVKWNIQRFFAAFCGLCALCLGLWGVRTAATAPDRPPVLLRESPEARETAQAMLDALCQGDLEAVSRHLSGTPALTQPGNGSEASRRVWQAYVDSMTYRFTSSVHGTSRGPAIDVQVDALDLAALMNRIRELVPKLLRRHIAQAKDISEIYDSGNGYRQDLVEQVLLEAIDAALKESPAACRTELTLTLRYQAKDWYVLPDNALILLISGSEIGA